MPQRNRRVLPAVALLLGAIIAAGVAVVRYNPPAANTPPLVGNPPATIAEPLPATGTLPPLLTATLPVRATLPPAARNPLAGATWYVDPAAGARRQADSLRARDPQQAALLDRIAGQPAADWFGDWNADIQTAVDTRVTTIQAAGAVPVLVAYNIPNRDCGQYSAGGAAAPAAYRAWMRAFAAGLAGRRAVVIVEPDALPLMDQCLSATDQTARMALIGAAVGLLKAQPGAAVYIDAGNSNWQPAATMATRLSQAGIAQADGFALNVSNYRATAELIAYARDLAARLGGKHAVLDTSRNGRGPADNNAWCNPPGRGLGTPPTTATADPVIDAYLWIKRPGESDGTCNGGPAAGGWWIAGALELARNAAP